jgi:transcriptional regulator with XRE-family HTH domain
MADLSASAPLGEKVKQLRENRSMERQELAAELGVAPEYLQRLEEGGFRPPVAMLLSLAQALKVDSMVLLADQDAPGADQRREEVVRRRAENYAYELLAPGHVQRHLKSFHITIEPGQGLEGPGYQHEGEEYHDVLEGELGLEVGEETHRLAAGESIYFDSSRVHKLHNPGDAPCRVLVVLYTP